MLCLSSFAITRGSRTISPGRYRAQRRLRDAVRAPAWATCSLSSSSSCCRSSFKTGDPGMRAWEAGLTWAFIQSFVLVIGGFHRPLGAPRSRRALPCSVRSRASRSPSAPRCARRCRCSSTLGDRAGLLRHPPGQLVSAGKYLPWPPRRPGRHGGRRVARVGLHPL